MTIQLLLKLMFARLKLLAFILTFCFFSLQIIPVKLIKAAIEECSVEKSITCDDDSNDSSSGEKTEKEKTKKFEENLTFALNKIHIHYSIISEKFYVSLNTYKYIEHIGSVPTPPPNFI